LRSRLRHEPARCSVVPFRKLPTDPDSGSLTQSHCRWSHWLPPSPLSPLRRPRPSLRDSSLRRFHLGSQTCAFPSRRASNTSRSSPRG
jgi:hypothetical protein